MKKLVNVIFWICFILTIFICFAIKPLSNLDELWNFNISRCISVGLVPYRDISMVSTPLLGFLGAIPLKIFGTELFIYRIMAVILFALMFFLVHRILRNLDVKSEVSCFVLLFLLSCTLDLFDLSYNLLSLLFLLGIILLEIKFIKKQQFNPNWNDIVIGILSGLIICTKQSIGIVIAFMVFFNPLFFIKSKNDVKGALIKLGFRLIGVVLPVMVFVIYLAVNGAFGNFIDYSILGIKTFSSKIYYSNLIRSEHTWVKVLSILSPIVLVVSIITNIIYRVKHKENSMCYILTIYSIAMFSEVFPISDNEHFIIAIIPTIVLITYAIGELLKKHIKFNYKYVIEFLFVFSILTTLALTLWMEVSNNDRLGRLSKYNRGSNYKYIYIPDNLYNSIDEIDKYIESSDKKVYILDATAVAYMIPINRYNKDYDMFCIGNLGSNGEDGQIEKIKSEDALYMIMSDDSNLNWQNPNKVRAYIKDNMELVEKVGVFDVYKNKP